MKHPLERTIRAPNPLAWRLSLPQPLSWNFPNPVALADAQVSAVDLLEKCLIFSFIALSPIQDLALQSTPLKGLAACLSLLPLLPLLAISGVRWVAGRMMVSKLVLCCCAYAALITLYGFWRFGLQSEGDNLMTKTATHFLVFLAYLLPAFLPIYQFRGAVRAGCYAAFVVLVFGILFSQGAPFGLPWPLENTPLHFIASSDMFRPRGFSVEPSLLSVTIIAIGLLCAHFTQRKGSRALFVLATAGLLMLCGSKGGFLLLVACASVLVLMRWHNWYQVPLLLLALAVIAYGASALVSRVTPDDWSIAAGTVQVRVTMVLAAGQASLHYPLGVGFSGFIPAIRDQLPETMTYIQGTTGVPLAFLEPITYLGSSEELSTKTFFFDGLVRFGWPFAILFVVLAYKLLKRLAQQRILFVAVLASLLAICTYVSLYGQFATAILLGVALSYARQSRRAS